MTRTAFQFLADHLDGIRLERSRRLRRWWWRAYRVLRPRGVVRVPVGPFRVWLDTRDSRISGTLIKYGHWEPGETRLFESLIRPRGVVIDIGASIGWFTLLACRRVGTGGTVIAFEPDPHNHALLSRNIAENHVDDIAQAQRMALSDRRGSLLLHRDAGNFGAHSLFAGNIEQSGDVIEVTATTLDGWLEANPPEGPVAVIKIDTQGAEPAILAGARETIARDRPSILVEFWPFGLNNAGHGVASLLDVPLSLDYELLLVEEGGDGIPLPVTEKDLLALAAEKIKVAGYAATLLCRPPETRIALIPPG